MLLTTQYLGEADQLADRIAVIDHGVVIADGTANELKPVRRLDHAATDAGRPRRRPAGARDRRPVPGRRRPWPRTARVTAGLNRSDVVPDILIALRGAISRSMRSTSRSRRSAGVPHHHRQVGDCRRRTRRWPDMTTTTPQTNPDHRPAIRTRASARLHAKRSVSLSETIAQSFSMAYRGVLKIRPAIPSSSSTSRSSRSSSPCCSPTCSAVRSAAT